MDEQGTEYAEHGDEREERGDDVRKGHEDVDDTTATRPYDDDNGE